MMKKKEYSTPLMDIVELKQQQPLLIGSYDGPANASEFDLVIDGLNNDEVTFTDDAAFDFSL